MTYPSEILSLFCVDPHVPTRLNFVDAVYYFMNLKNVKLL